MIISNIKIEDSKKYYPIITFKCFIGRKNKKFDYVITAPSNKYKDKFVFEQMKLDGFDVKHIKCRIISGGSYAHDFGLNLDDYYNHVTFVTPCHSEYELISKLYDKMKCKLNR